MTGARTPVAKAIQTALHAVNPASATAGHSPAQLQFRVLRRLHNPRGHHAANQRRRNPQPRNRTKYTYDNASRITAIADAQNSALSWTYGYDANDRLTSANSIGLTQSFTFDTNGNRLTQGGSTSTTLTPASTSNRLLQTTGSLVRTYSYDAAGNTLSDGTATFTYSDAGRMLTATKSGVTTTYAYNALGQRVKKSNTSATAHFVYDEAGHLLGEYDAAGNVRQEFIWLGDTPVAVNDALPTSPPYWTYHLHTDHLNTVRRVTRIVSPTVVWRWDSDAFGTTAANEDPDGDTVPFKFNLRFPGQYFDAETGLNYNYFRDYDPQIGRYAESDPIGLAAGVNTYGYAGTKPVSAIDPLGLWEWGDSLPQEWVDPITGFGDGAFSALTFGLGDLQDVRDLTGDLFGYDASVDRCSASYSTFYTAGAVTGSVWLAGRALRAVAGPRQNWIRFGPSHSRSLGVDTRWSMRWGASPIKKGKYLKQIPFQFMRDLNQWLRQKSLPFGGTRSADPGHFHIIF